MDNLTSIVILTWNNLEYTQKCISSIGQYTKKDSYEIIIVDNGSTDGTIDWLKSQNDIKCIFNDKNNGFPGGCNQGINISNGDNILLLNNDIIVTPNWLENLKIALYSSNDIGAVSAITNYASYYHSIPISYDINDMNSMIDFASQINISDPKKWHRMLKLIGFCFLVKREVINKIGLLDEIFFPGNYEDDDYSLRIRGAGYKLLLCKDTFVHHYGNATCKNLDISKIIHKNRNLFMQKWNIDAIDATKINTNIINLIKSCQQDANILEIDCSFGGTLLSLKNKFNTINLFGTNDNNINKELISNDINILNKDDIFNYKDFFDIIIINNKEDILHIEKYSEILKNNAIIITTIDYIYNFEFLDYLKNNNWKYYKIGFINECFKKNNKSTCEFNHEFVILSKNNIIKKSINSNKKRAIACYIDNQEYLINEFYGMYSSIKYINAKDTDIVVFGPKDVLYKIPNDCIKIECNPICDQQPWSNPKLPFPYKFINSIYFLTIPEANVLLNYDYVLKTDVDVFIAPEWNNFFPPNYTVGKGAYVNDQLTYDKIRSVAKELNLNTKPDYNLGATHYGKPQDIINVMKLTYEVSKYWIENIFIHEYGKWPSLWYGVTSMYAGEIAINHLINKVNKESNKIDYNSNREEKFNNQIHIHCYHTDEDFSKIKFRKGEYDNVDISKLDLNIIKDYCLYHILNGQKIKREN